MLFFPHARMLTPQLGNLQSNQQQSNFPSARVHDDDHDALILCFGLFE